MRFFIAALLVSITACADSPVSVPTSHSSSSANAAAQTGCATACRVALGICEVTADDRQLIQDCASDCPFSADEVECLGQLTCGDDASVCD